MRHNHLAPDSHVLIVRCSSVLLVRRDVDLVPGRNRNVLVAHCVARADFRALGVEGNRQGPAKLLLLCLAGVIDDRLVVLERSE